MSRFDPFAIASPSDSSNANDKNGGIGFSSTSNADNNNSAAHKLNPFDVFGTSSSNGSNGHTSNQSGGGGMGMASLMNPFQFSNVNSTPAAAPSAVKHKRVVPYHGPIADLASNWDPWLHSARANNDNSAVNMTYLIVKGNASCSVPGGVESVLKWMKLNKNNCNSSGGVTRATMDDLTMNLESSTMMMLDDNRDNQQLDLDSNKNVNNTFFMTNNNDTASNNNSNAIYYSSSSSSSSGNYANKNFGKIFKSGLKNVQATITNSVTSIAIKADGGKNPDWVCASLHYCYNLGGGGGGGRNNCCNNEFMNKRLLEAIGGGHYGGGSGGVSDICLSKTEWITLPSLSNVSGGGGGSSSSSDGEQKDKHLSFAVPLCVPDLSFLESDAGDNNGIQLTIRLYLRSGATLLKAAAIKKEYCIGECSFMYSQLGSNSSSGGKGGHYHTMNLSFTNGMLADPSSHSLRNGIDSPPMLNLMALPRIKFNPSCKVGWSLTDPTPIPPSSVAALRWLNMFQLPLDQAYSYPMGSDGAGGAMILANECARESTVTLPIATACSKLFSDAAIQSQQRASMIAAQSRRRESVRSYAIRPDMDVNRANAIVDMALKDGCMEVDVGVVAFVVHGDHRDSPIGGIPNLTSGAERVPFVRMSVTFQRHDSIFEEGITSGSVPLMDEQVGAAFIGGNSVSAPVAAIPGGGMMNEAIRARFCPRILSGVPENDGLELLHGVHGTKPNGKYVGNVRFEVANTLYVNVNDNLIVPSGQNAPIEGLLELEPYLDLATACYGKGVPVLVPATDANNGKRIGTYVLVLRVRALLGGTSPPSLSLDAFPPASSGLVSAVGLDALNSALVPGLDLDYDVPTPNSQQPPSATAVEMRRRKVATMGSFLTPRYLQNQADVVRSNVSSTLCDRYDKYYTSLMSGFSPDMPIEDDSDVELYQRRSPRPFRPSNSRSDELLAGIGFNVHCQGLSIDVLRNGVVTPAAVSYSITHGAPADHSAGFGVQGMDEAVDFGGDLSSGARGGLRRLEMKRLEFAKELDDSISGLIGSVGEHFKVRAQAAAARQQADFKPSRHIPPGNSAIEHFRNKAIECAQKLNSLTWSIAVRRANCFSQALGIAVTSYLANLSDASHASKGFAQVWSRHGYLITFEGLLSAVGKELGMIEDASIAVQMLRKVNIVLVPDDSNISSSTIGARKRVPVPHSPYVRWVHLAYLTPNGSHSKNQYRLEIGLSPSYYQNRVPEPLKNGTAVQLYPTLFQMGVDIRQWGVNAGRNVSNQIKDKSKGGGFSTSESLGDALADTNEVNGGLIDDGDDDGDEAGMADNEIGFQLNVDGFRKLNAYAHSVNPTVAGSTAASSPPPVFDSSEQAQMQSLPPHPLLVSLSECIKASAGKMEHGVLDHAAASCQRLGGGSTVFCKSGKDRTGMQVTFKEAQFIQRFVERNDSVSSEEVFAKATTMRIHGNRVPICEKNAGEAKYAFNPLQAQFMPAMLKPPPITTQWKKPET